MAAQGATITSGTITFTGANYPVTFDFSTSQHSVTGTFSPGPQSSQCHPCAPGDGYTIAGVITGGDFKAGTVDGSPVLWVNPWGWSFFTWAGGPPGFTISGPGQYFSRFSFEGTLCADNGSASSIKTCSFSSPVEGAGDVRVNLVEISGLLWQESAVFTFDENQVPEPASIVLTGLGIGALIIVRQRLAQARQTSESNALRQ